MPAGAVSAFRSAAVHPGASGAPATCRSCARRERGCEEAWGQRVAGQMPRLRRHRTHAQGIRGDCDADAPSPGRSGGMRGGLRGARLLPPATSAAAWRRARLQGPASTAMTCAPRSWPPAASLSDAQGQRARRRLPARLRPPPATRSARYPPRRPRTEPSPPGAPTRVLPLAGRA